MVLGKVDVVAHFWVGSLSRDMRCLFAGAQPGDESDINLVPYLPQGSAFVRQITSAQRNPVRALIRLRWEQTTLPGDLSWKAIFLRADGSLIEEANMDKLVLAHNKPSNYTAFM